MKTVGRLFIGASLCCAAAALPTEGGPPTSMATTAHMSRPLPASPAPHGIRSERAAAIADLPPWAAYLDLFDATHRPCGNSQTGEIETLLEPMRSQSIEKAAAQRLQAKGWPAAKAAEATRVGILLQDPFFTIVRDAVRFPGGNEGVYIRRISASRLDGGVAGVDVVPILPNGDFVLLVEYRYPEPGWRLGLASGFRELHETPEQAARRELEEESGREVLGLQSLGTTMTEDGEIPLFAGFVGVSAPHPLLDPEEAFDREQVTLSIDELRHILIQGEFTTSSGRTCFLHHALPFALLRIEALRAANLFLGK